VSSSHQEKEGASLATQEEACRRYSAEKGWTIDERFIYRETHKRWLLHERPEMTRLRADAKQRQFDIVLCYCVDRLSSQDAHVYILDEEFEKAEVRLDFATETFEDTAIGRFIRSAKVFSAAVEVEKISERTVRGRIARINDRKLLIPGAKPPYGYCWPDERNHKGLLIKGRLIEDPETAPVVKRLFREIVSGTTLRQLSIALTNEGVPTPGGKSNLWHTGTIAHILHKHAYKGDAYAWGWVKSMKGRPQTFDPEKAILLPEGTIPPLVDAGTWEAAQGVLQRNKARAIRSAKDPESALLRGGYVKCGYCGSTMYPRPRSNGALEYVCRRGGEHPSQCMRPSLVTHRLDDAVWSRVEELLTNPSTIREKLEEQRSEGYQPVADELAASERLLVKLEQQQSMTAHAVTMLTTSDAAAPLVARLEQIADQKRGVSAERERLLRVQEGWYSQQADLSDLETWCTTVAENLSELAFPQKRLALDVLGITATVYKADHQPRFVITSQLTSATQSCTT